MAELFAEIAVFNALDKTLHYQIPSQFMGKVQAGIRVLIPLGRREALGLILSLEPTPPILSKDIKFRSVMALLDDQPVTPPDLIQLCQWLSKYYCYPLGEVLQAALPGGMQVKPVQYLRLSSKGRAALELTKQPRLLARLSTEEKIALRELISNTSNRSSLRKELKELEQKGLIESFYTWPTPKVRPKRTKTIMLIAAPPGDQLAKNANLKSLVEMLEQTAGSLPVRILRQHVKNVDYWIEKLAQAGVVKVAYTDELRESQFAQTLPGTVPSQPTADQKNVLAAITPHLSHPSFQPFLVYGVTGSGKTEIYLRLVAETLRHGRGAIVLVPEIALSTQMEGLFRQRFGPQLAVCHSGLPAGARYDQWREVLVGNRKVILGVRSAIFMPVVDLGLIIVDEEHDSSYKQEDRLRYHARNVALMRGQMLKIPIVLGSATPSLQSIHYSTAGRYQLLSLPRRIFDRPLPTFEIVDMRREQRGAKILSQALQTALLETVQNGHQALIFLNRRGFATFLMCHLCGYVLQCSYCSVSLTYHQKDQRMRCHYCGSEAAPPEQCPACGQASMIYHGFGTERVSEEVKKLLPQATIVRIDRDTISHSQTIVEHLNAIRQCRANILIGTQMIAKGHDFPNITLVGIVNADTALQIADFRAGESTVQLLMQVAGRAGRGDNPGRVILQTYNPQHYTIESVVNMDYLSFCDKELESRARLQYPPFTRLVKILVTSPDEAHTRQAALKLASMCRNLAARFRSRKQPLAVLGPSPAPILRLNQRYRWQIFVKAWSNQTLQQFIETLLEQSKGVNVLRRVQVAIDRDPTTSL